MSSPRCGKAKDRLERGSTQCAEGTSNNGRGIHVARGMVSSSADLEQLPATMSHAKEEMVCRTGDDDACCLSRPPHGFLHIVPNMR
mmetsp:Transcript_79270/g.229255  ORF Transcript_79270/g.229255 Transcript_79270/m.229255 type:complete len:86 (+) Transcript_79270:825-1082(+)